MPEKQNEFLFKDTTATKKIFGLKKRIRAVSGGTSASKTISILVWLIDYAQTHNNELITVVSESFPHLSGGAMLDFENIMKRHGYWEDKSYVKSPKATYTFKTGTKIEFISVDTYGKAHGPRRDILFINEANNLPYNIADQLITRTRKIVWMDWNPTTEFWFYTEMKDKRDDIDFITLTYKDNEALDDTTVNEIESHKGNKNWWLVYGLGKLGELEGKIYTGWRIVDDVPEEARLERYGLDFGFSHDPAAIVAVYYYNGEYILDEITYAKELHNKDLADVIKNLPNALTIADSAEPKSIDEIRSYGVNIIGAKKKAIVYGGKKPYNKWAIDQVQSCKIAMTKRSVNLIKEYRNYMWKTDKDGKILTEPEDGFDHALDAVKYAITSINSIIRRNEYITNLPHTFVDERKPVNIAR